MTGCLALGLLPVACASVGWQRARLVSSDRATKKSNAADGPRQLHVLEQL